MSNPFTQKSETLVSFAIGVVLPEKGAADLVKGKEKGQEQMNSFIENRLQSNKSSFWDPIPSLKLITFESITKKVKALIYASCRDGRVFPALRLFVF